MSRGSWAKRNEWEDKNSYFFGINAAFFSSVSTAVYIPLVGRVSESTSPVNADTQYIPPSNGRLKSLSIYSSNGTAPGDTVVTLTHNGGAGDIGQKLINIPSQTLTTFTFRDELTSGIFEWDISNGTSLAVELDPANNYDTMQVFVLFEIYK